MKFILFTVKWVEVEFNIFTSELEICLSKSTDVISSQISQKKKSFKIYKFHLYKKYRLIILTINEKSLNDELNLCL
jgi:hypothetical protein